MTRRLASSIAVACLATLAGTTALAAPADNAAMRFVSASLQRDARHDQVVRATISLPFGERAWAQGGGGQTRTAAAGAAHRAGLLSGGVGYIADGWQAALEATHRRDGSRYRQTDWAGLVEWQRGDVTAGVDLAYRDARQEASVATPNAQGGTAVVPVMQRVRGSGFGVHGSVLATDKLSLYGAAMRYHYETQARQTGAVTGAGANEGGGIAGALLGNQALLARSLTRPSAVSRDEAVLSRSVQFGATYRFQTVAVSAETLADRVLDTPDTARTVQLKAELELTRGWTLLPALGRTRSDAAGAVNFGALTLRHAW